MTRAKENARNSETLDPEYWNARLSALERYFQSHPGYSVETLFGILKHNDDRFEDIFETLKDMGYNPRKTYYMDRITTCALTIDVPTREVPDDVVEVVEKYPELIIRHVDFHKGRNSYKAKFELRDGDYKRMDEDLWKEHHKSTE